MTAETYSPEELSKVAGAVLISGLAVAVVDAGIISTAIEATALAKEIAGAAKKYPSNTIIQSLFSEEALKQAKESPVTKMELTPEQLQSDRAIDTAIAKVNEALAILNEKATPEEIQQYKEFIYSSADTVAKAAGSGLFGSGVKVSEAEAAALAKLKAALDI
jgi:hypothetical protein